MSETDFRLPENRRAVFHDFYEFHLRYYAHPGCVYYLMPDLADRYQMDDEQQLWFAFLNGNTQHPITSLMLYEFCERPGPDVERMLTWYRAEYGRLAWDTDRRYHKKSLAESVAGYLGLLAGRPQKDFWEETAARGWPAVWAAATSIPTFGRLSAFSYAEYLRIMGIDLDCDDLMLADRDGSRSHRNGLCKVLGLDQYDWHASNPAFDGRYPRDLLSYLEGEAIVLLAEARKRAAGQAWERDVSYLTLESTLCTYKGWHRPNRRYPNVYNDMLYNRIRAAEEAFPNDKFDIFWEARADWIPAHLLLEEQPHDPGLVAVKQNWYLETGEPIMMDHEFPQYRNGFNDGVREGRFGLREDQLDTGSLNTEDDRIVGPTDECLP